MEVIPPGSALRRWWLRQVAALRGCWMIPGADASLRERLLATQIRGAREADVGDLVMIFSAMLVLWFDVAPHPGWWAWLIGVALWSQLLRPMMAASRTSDPLATMPLYRWILFHRLAMALCFSVGMSWLYVNRPLEMRLVIGGAWSAPWAAGLCATPVSRCFRWDGSWPSSSPR